MKYATNSRTWLLIFTASMIALNCMQPLTDSFARQQFHQVTKEVSREVTFLAVGDIMLSRGVARAISRANNPRLPFSRLSQLLASTDFNFGNLESPFSGKDRITGKGLRLNAERRNLEGLAAYNFKVLNLANNHALDQSLAGLLQTRKYLEENGIEYLGAGKDKSEAWQPKIVPVRGLKIGFIGASYSSYNDGGGARNDYVARIEDVRELHQAIARLKSEADFIVVTMHAGIEYARRPDQAQMKFARTAIDYGADLVIGAHPHWIQTVEYYNGRCIFYSLGNFIFDQGWSRETKEGLMISVTLRPGEVNSIAGSPSVTDGDHPAGASTRASISRIEVIPIIIENDSTPRKASDAEAQQILQKITIPAQCINPQVERRSE